MDRKLMGFNDLPLDALIQIQSFMQPLDILSLRQCSKAMQSATTHRTVWMDALRRICATHAVPKSTYPLDKMSLTDLVHAASAPARFILAIRRAAESETETLQPFAVRLFIPRLARSSQQNLGNILHMRLVPGGRHLFTASSTGLVCLWDLGYGPASLISPSPIATAPMPQVPSQLLLQATRKQNGARVVVFYPLNGMVTDVLVFEVVLGTRQPSFRKIAERRIASSNLLAFALSPDRFTYHYDTVVTIWDFVEDTAATIDVSGTFNSLTVSPATIICQRVSGQWLVDIPPLHPSGSPLAEDPVQPFCPMVLSHITGLFEDSLEISHQADWLLDSSAPVVLDVFGYQVEGDWGYARCVVRPMPNASAGLPGALPALIGITAYAIYEGVEDIRTAHYAQNAQQDVIRTWFDGNIRVNVAPVPDVPEPSLATASAFISDIAGLEYQTVYDLDALSGRLVVQTPTEVRVLDFLVPSNV
ncbi:hypothetical protein C8F01DRAFT_1253502 [Mycena amicta]|nr:hypothetical protein C8F01DRAFT_1253502 [Mycena amicta]